MTPTICVSFVPSQGLRQSSDAHSRALAHAVFSEQNAEKPGEQTQLRLAVFGALDPSRLEPDLFKGRNQIVIRDDLGWPTHF